MPPETSRNYTRTPYRPKIKLHPHCTNDCSAFHKKVYSHTPIHSYLHLPKTKLHLPRRIKKQIYTHTLLHPYKTKLHPMVQMTAPPFTRRSTFTHLYTHLHLQKTKLNLPSWMKQEDVRQYSSTPLLTPLKINYIKVVKPIDPPEKTTPL